MNQLGFSDWVDCIPESWPEDRERCRESGLPNDMVDRPKWEIALVLYDRATAGGMEFDWLGFNERYGGKLAFLGERQMEIYRNWHF